MKAAFLESAECWYTGLGMGVPRERPAAHVGRDHLEEHVILKVRGHLEESVRLILARGSARSFSGLGRALYGREHGSAEGEARGTRGSGPPRRARHSEGAPT